MVSGTTPRNNENVMTEHYILRVSVTYGALCWY